MEIKSILVENMKIPTETHSSQTKAKEIDSNKVVRCTLGGTLDLITFP